MPQNPFKRLVQRREPTPVKPVAGAHATPKTPRYGVVTKGGRKAEKARRNADRQPGFLARVVNDWWNRLITAVFGGKFSEQTEQYLAHQTKRDYVCNTIGQAAWGMLFPLLTMVATWLVGAEQAGLFSMAFTVGTLLLFLANYGVRTYQVSDLDDMRSFLDYQINRFLTCAAMITTATCSRPAWACSCFARPTAWPTSTRGASSRRTSSTLPASHRLRAAFWDSWPSR